MKLETEIEVRSKKHLQLPFIATGAAKDNEMNIFEIMTLIKAALIIIFTEHFSAF